MCPRDTRGKRQLQRKDEWHGPYLQKSVSPSFHRPMGMRNSVEASWDFSCVWARNV